ncbi:hypothetical protein CBR_g49086 [Chara braunii]|uniref:Integrase catalytic domain-containing protein n=1 Tax=Chara braunii TaxID=69332 RepID=A0A388K4P9_CHABU|nr:hypothetical protein CBR_g49086 [Chara braunii]|eukprot:GBG65017.1 hypothetical protein CBR_g49086 [Chara braunii]
MVIELVLGTAPNSLFRQAEREVVSVAYQRAQMEMDKMEVRVELGDRGNVTRPLRTMRVGKGMASEEEAEGLRNKGSQGTDRGGEWNEGSVRDRESAKPEWTREDGKDHSTGESSGKAGGSKRGPQESREKMDNSRANPRNSDGTTSKKTKVSDARRKLAEIEKRTAKYKARLIEEMMAGNEGDLPGEELRGERRATQSEVGHGGKDSSHKGSPSKRGKEKGESPVIEAKKATTPPAMDSGATRLPTTPKVTKGCDGLWSLRERVLGWFDPESMPKAGEKQRDTKEGEGTSAVGKPGNSKGGLKRIVATLTRALNKNQGYLADAKKKLTFGGANITEFLIDYENLTALLKWTEEEKMDHLGQHVSLSLGRDIMAIVASSGSWKETRNEMMRKNLKAEKMTTKAELAAVQRKNYATYNDFLRAFTLVALRIPEASPRLLKGLRQLLTRRRVEVEEAPEPQEPETEEAEAPQGVSNLQRIPGDLEDLEKVFVDIRLSLPDREGGEVRRAPPGTKLSFHALPAGKLKVQIGTHHTDALVDDGAEITLIRRDFATITGMRGRVEIMIEEAFDKKEWIKMGLPLKKRRQEDEVLGVMVAEKEAEVEFGANLPKSKEDRKETSEVVLEVLDLLQLVEAIRYHKAYLFGRRFILRIDPTNVAGALKNYKPIDLTVGRWIGFIWQFDYKVERIAGLRNRADGLSRVRITPEGVEDAEPIDAFLEYEGGTLIVDNEMACTAPTMDQLLIQALEKGASTIVAELREGPIITFRRKNENDSWGATIGSKEELMAMAVEGGQDALMNLTETWTRRERRYLVNQAQEGQNTDQKGHKFFLIQMYDGTFREIGLLLIGNKQPMQVSLKAREEARKYFLDARDNLSGYVEAVTRKRKMGKGVANWIKDFYLRHPFVRRFIADNGMEFVNHEVLSRLKTLCVPIKIIEPYHPDANAPVERGHRTLKITIAKLAADDLGNWSRYLKQVVFAENMTPKRTTGCIPAELSYGREIDFSVEALVPTWNRLDDNPHMSTEETDRRTLPTGH